MDRPLHLMIAHSGSIGDNLNLTSFAAAVKRKFPLSVIIAVVTRHEEVLKNCPVINYVIRTVDANKSSELMDQSRDKFDIIFDYRYSVGCIFTEDGLKRPEVVAYKKEYEKAHRKYEHSFEEFLNDIESVDKLNEPFYDMALNSCGLEGTPEETYIDLSTEDYNAIEKYKGLRYMVVCNSADGGNQTKSWSHKYWEEVNLYLINRGITPIQVGYKNDYRLPRCERFLGTVSESAALIKQSLGCILIEGAVAHVAKAVGIDSVVLFGATPVKMFGYSNNINLRSSVCSPCWWRTRNWFDTCKLENKKVSRTWAPPCMTAIKPITVIKAIEKLLDRKHV